MPPPPGRCWSCGYDLRATPASECPECARPFDPADPRSTNAGRPLGALARRALAPPSYAAVAALVADAALVAWATGRPADWGERAFLDLPLYRSRAAIAERWADGSPQYRAFLIGLALAALAVAWSALRGGARLLVRWRRRPPADLTPRRPLRAAALLAAACVAGYFVAAGGARRVAREWAHKVLHPPALAPAPAPVTFPPGASIRSTLFALPIRRGPGDASTDPPLPLSAEAQRTVLRALLLHGDTAQHRIVGLKLLVDRATPPADPPLLIESLARQTDPDLIAWHLRLLGLANLAGIAGASPDAVVPYLDHPAPAARAGAADALALIHGPTQPLPPPYAWTPIPTLTLTDPPIDIRGLLRSDAARWRYQPDDPSAPVRTDAPPLPADRRARLERMMLTGPTEPERAAAARALVPFPPADYQLRLAEWGVWLNEAGDLKTATAINADVPPFVHRTGNLIAEMAPRVNPIMFISKPVIHLTAGAPLAVDLEVRLHLGRPWLVYPRPDDLEVMVDRLADAGGARGAATRPALLAPLDNPALPPLTDLHPGFPWLNVVHRAGGSVSGKISSYNAVTEMGVHWQSLIVSPAKPAWLAEPAVPPDPRFAWWRRLRDVPSAWVSSRGEGDRFLYYDGPTLLRAPFTATLAGGHLRLVPTEDVDYPHRVLGAPTSDPAVRAALARAAAGASVDPRRRAALLVRVDPAGRPTAEDVAGLDDPGGPRDHTIGSAPPHAGPAAEARLRALVEARGLTPAEATGLLDTWRHDFFAQPGTRLLLILSPNDYDAFCPMVCRPIPTRITRVGVIVTELGK